MAIVQLQNAANLTELAGGIYGLDAKDPRVATAAKALAAANPHLPVDLRGVPAATPVVIPEVAGLAPVVQPASAVPQNANLLKLVQDVGDAARQIVAATQPGQTTTDSNRAAMLQRFAAARTVLKGPAPAPPPAGHDPHAALVKALHDDVVAFVKLHGG